MTLTGLAKTWPPPARRGKTPWECKEAIDALHPSQVEWISEHRFRVTLHAPGAGSARIVGLPAGATTLKDKTYYDATGKEEISVTDTVEAPVIQAEGATAADCYARIYNTLSTLGPRQYIERSNPGGHALSYHQYDAGQEGFTRRRAKDMGLKRAPPGLAGVL